MAKRNMTENTMAKRKMTDNTMAKRKRTTGQTTIYTTLRCSVRLYLQLFIGERMSYLRCLYIFCICFRIIVSNAYCVVSLLYCSSSCVLYVASLSGLSFLIVPSVFSNVYLHRKLKIELHEPHYNRGWTQVLLLSLCVSVIPFSHLNVNYCVHIHLKVQGFHTNKIAWKSPLLLIMQNLVGNLESHKKIFLT